MNINDLAKINEPANAGVWIAILDPNTQKEIQVKGKDGNEKPLRVRLYGATSDHYYGLRDQIQDEMFQAAYEGKPIDKEDQGMRLVAGMIAEFDELTMPDGQPCTAENALEVLKTPGLKFIYKQLDMEIKKRENFIKP